MENKKFNLEQKLRELEEIANKIQNPNVDIDKALELYRRGVQLSSECRETIKSIEQEVEELSKEHIRRSSTEK